MGSDKTAFEWMAEKIEYLTGEKIDVYPEVNRKLQVPVCYSFKFGTELQELAQHNGLSTEEVIRIHTSKSYRVYMLVFDQASRTWVMWKILFQWQGNPLLKKFQQVP